MNENQIMRMRMLCPICQPVSGATGRCSCTERCPDSMCWWSPLAPDEYVAPAVPRFR